MIPIPTNVCVLCGAEAGQSETEGNFVRFVCRGPCGRYVISWGAIRRILLAVGGATAVKQTYAERAASTAATGRILVLRIKHDHIEEETILPDDSLWTAESWPIVAPPLAS